MPTAIPPRRLLAIAVAAALAAGCVAAVNTPAPNVGQPEQASPNSFRG
jgi:uncharacterized cupredoxin-like copper-binding protein